MQSLSLLLCLIIFYSCGLGGKLYNVFFINSPTWFLLAEKYLLNKCYVISENYLQTCDSIVEGGQEIGRI